MYIKELFRRNINHKSFGEILAISSVVLLMDHYIVLSILAPYFDLEVMLIIQASLFGFLLLSGIFGLVRASSVISFDDHIFRFLMASVLSNSIFSLVNIGQDPLLSRFLGMSIFVFTVIVLVRWAVFYSLSKANDESITVLDLKNFLLADKDSLRHKPIYIEEADVSYDLLGREKIITDLYDSINECKSNKRFVISISGSWGSGKTTIINNVKKALAQNDDFVIIDSFEIWKYGNVESMFYDFFDQFLRSIEIRFSIVELRRFYRACISVITSKMDIDSRIILDQNNDSAIATIKNEIEAYLLRKNKRIVYIIDNLERTDAQNIITVIKAITTILNIGRTIFVLSFDEKELKTVFEQKLGISYDYLDKIIQLPLYVPEMSSDEINSLSRDVFKKIFDVYDIDTSRDNLEEFFSVLPKCIKDIRSLKRKVNSILCTSVKSNHLNILDLLLLDFIRQDNYDLYCSISEHSRYLVSEDIDTLGYDFTSAKDYNALANSFIKNLISQEECKNYISILSFLFPNVDKYVKSREKGVEYKSENPSIIVPRDRVAHRKSVIERRIYNGRFFNLYFTKKENHFIVVDSITKKYVYEYLNDQKYDRQEIINEFIMIVEQVESYQVVLLMELLDLYSSEITSNFLAFLMAIHESIDKYPNQRLFFQLNAYDRSAVLASTIIQKLTDSDFGEYRQFIEARYKDIGYIHSLVYWLSPERAFSEGNSQIVYEKIQDSYDGLINKITNTPINIYDEENYRWRNLWAFMPDNIDYNVEICLNTENILLFIADTLAISVGTQGYGYSISEKVIQRFTSVEFVKEMVDLRIMNGDMSEMESFLTRVFQRFISDYKNGKDVTVFSNLEFDLSLLGIKVFALRNISETNT